jgi:hypothetical protein
MVFNIINIPSDFIKQKGFMKSKLHDIKKTIYCNRNGINLIRIPYSEIDRIEVVLLKKLNSL